MVQGVAFDMKVDVFSYGIVLCEIVCRLSAASGFITRQLPSFAVNQDYVRGFVSEGCVPGFFEISMLCAAVEAEERPSWKRILDVLRTIEINLPNLDHAGTLRGTKFL